MVSTPLVGLNPIPWAFVDHPAVKMWVWRTDHFEAQVTADGHSFSWTLVDFVSTTDPAGVLLVEGRTGSFSDAELAIRESVGKSYPPKSGYLGFAGPLATTFTLATGERVDLGLYTGIRIVVTVRYPDGRELPFIGDAKVVHYELRLTQDSGQTIRILPSHIVSVAAEVGLTKIDARASYTGMGRIYRGTVVAGCTGVPGFMPNTVDHSGRICGVHEDSFTTRR